MVTRWADRKFPAPRVAHYRDVVLASDPGLMRLRLAIRASGTAALSALVLSAIAPSWDEGGSSWRRRSRISCGSASPPNGRNTSSRKHCEPSRRARVIFDDLAVLANAASATRRRRLSRRIQRATIRLNETALAMEDQVGANRPGAVPDAVPDAVSAWVALIFNVELAVETLADTIRDITVNTITAARVTGTFQFSAVPVSGSGATGTVTVTNGKFALSF